MAKNDRKWLIVLQELRIIDKTTNQYVLFTDDNYRIAMHHKIHKMKVRGLQFETIETCIGSGRTRKEAWRSVTSIPASDDYVIYYAKIIRNQEIQ